MIYNSHNKRIVIVGGSRGIGLALARHFDGKVKELISISRSPSPHGRWIACDVSDEQQVLALREQIGSAPVDALLYLGGVWEKNAFTSDYDFLKSNLRETKWVIDVNLIAPIWLVQTLLPNLSSSENARVLFIGSLTAMDNTASKEVANSASKYGLRGASQALDVALREKRIGFTALNPGNIATEEVNYDIASGAFHEQIPIPMEDLIHSIEFCLSMSKHTVVREINLTQMYP